MNERIKGWFDARGVSASVLSAAFVHWDDGKKAIVIPVRRRDGTWFSKYRRDPAKKTGVKYWADAGGSRTLYLSQDIQGARDIHVVEGELDALRVKSAGHVAVSSTAGASNWDEAWSELFRNKTVYVWYDADEAGDKGSLAVAGSVARFASIVYRVRHDPEIGKDVTDVLQRLGDSILDEGRIRKGLVPGVRCEAVAAPPPRPLHAPRPTTHDGPKPSLTAVLEKYGVTLVRGRVARCPLHDDRAPSLSVSEDKGLWYCHAGCGGGDVYTLVEKMEKCGFKEAKEIISKLC